jgi:hypothetical protein
LIVSLFLGSQAELFFYQLERDDSGGGDDG